AKVPVEYHASLVAEDVETFGLTRADHHIAGQIDFCQRACAGSKIRRVNRRYGGTHIRPGTCVEFYTLIARTIGCIYLPVAGRCNNAKGGVTETKPKTGYRQRFSTVVGQVEIHTTRQRVATEGVGLATTVSHEGR